MIELAITILAIYLFIKALGLVFRISWGTAKIIATLLMALALPVFIVCLIFAGGFFLLIPVAVLAGAVRLLKSVV